MGGPLSWGPPPWGPSWKDTWQGWGLSTHRGTRLPALLSPRRGQTQPVPNGPTGWEWGHTPEALLVWGGLWGKALIWLCCGSTPSMGTGTPRVGNGTHPGADGIPSMGNTEPLGTEPLGGMDPQGGNRDHHGGDGTPGVGDRHP